MKENNTIVFLCHFSNSLIRNKLILKDYHITNGILRLLNKKAVRYIDFAIWVSDYISEFEKHTDYSFYIVSPHKGMVKEYQQFDINGINYIFFKCDRDYLSNLYRSRYRVEEKNDYARNRGVIHSIIKTISPKLIILCGAENPSYSSSVLDIKDIPIYVIPQTLLNDKKRIDMGVGSPYRRKIELEIFRHANYYCTSDEKTVNRIREENEKAAFLPAGFPTHRPVVTIPEVKDYDFVFFARKISKNKGIEDLLHAFARVKSTHNESSLNIIGSCISEYKTVLCQLVTELGINNNVYFSGYFDQITETYECVVKARVVVVPGITAELNSTVREAMFLGLPTICYETPATNEINKKKVCLLTASMNDVEKLAQQMQYAIEHPLKAREIAQNGKDYAESYFSNKTIVNRLLNNCQQIINKQV